MTPAHVADAFDYQSKACENLGSPFMAQLMRLCATQDWPNGAIKDRIFGWPGDLGPGDQSVPLRLAGALHALHLLGHDGLAHVYPPESASDDNLWEAVSAALVSDTEHINTWLNSAPQTNEVRRSVTLIAAGHVLAERFGLPIHTTELGASGGLNLHWDAYGMIAKDQKFGAATPALILTPDWTGPLPPAQRPEVVARAGVDLNPLDPADPQDALRLQAYLWPDQPERLALTRAAIATAKTPVAKADAITWLKNRLDQVPKRGQTHLIYSTVAWQYFPAESQAAGTALIEAAGAKATADTPLAWFGMENDGSARGAALTLRVWPQDETLTLGRADFHGRWVEWAGAEGN